MGELAIVRAREKAEKTLGAKFNIRAFHDAVLELGSVPLPVVTPWSCPCSSPKTASALHPDMEGPAKGGGGGGGASA